MRRGAFKGHPPYNVNGEGGRKRKYSVEDIERFADDLLVWIKQEENYWLKDFCLEKDIDPDNMSIWARENEKFEEVYKLAKGYQESKIFKGSMNESFNCGMSKFALINCHGWVDKTESKLSGDQNSPLAFILNSVSNSSKDLVNDSNSFT